MKKEALSDDRIKQVLFLRESRRGIGLLAKQAYSLGLAALLLAGLALHSSAQLKVPAPPPPKAQPAPPVDPLGRQTPRGTVLGFLRYEQNGDYSTASRYLQLPPSQNTNLVQLRNELQVLTGHFNGNIDLLSDDPNGMVDPALPPGQARAGVIALDGATVDVMLVRVNDPASGKIWLVSRQTLENIAKLYAQVKSKPLTEADRLRAAVQSGPQVFGMSSKQWLGWLLSVPISWVLAWLLTFLFSAPRRVWCKIRKVGFHTIWETPLGMPLRCMIAILLHGSLVYLLQPPLLYRVYYARFLAALMAVCFGWLLSRISDQGFDVALRRTRTHRGSGESILIMVQKLSSVGILIIALIAAVALLGVNVSATLTGLGIGGLAVALAAQKTLENLIGGVSLLLDKAIRVGDFCKIGDQLGTVEDIGLRSLKLRTLDQNVLVVPNGALAQMQFQNMQARPKLLINQNFSLPRETRVEQLLFVLDSVQTMLNEHAAIESGSWVRVIDLAGGAFELQLFAYGKTGDWAQFITIRQDVILKIVSIVEAAGTRFVGSTRLTYQHPDPGMDAEKAADIVRHVTELRAGEAFELPGAVPAGTK